MRASGDLKIIATVLIRSSSRWNAIIIKAFEAFPVKHYRPVVKPYIMRHSIAATRTAITVPTSGAHTLMTHGAQLYVIAYLQHRRM